MANSKNTIQNIPLEGELCMNSLKTEVKQFQGYNEKNTTFYGGTLSPIYDKTTELFDKNNSYTVFNSKGVPYTLKSNGELYKGNERIRNFSCAPWPKTSQIPNTPDDTVLVAMHYNRGNSNKYLYITSDKIIGADGTVIKQLDTDSPMQKILSAKAWYCEYNTIIVLVGNTTNTSDGIPVCWICTVDPNNNFHGGRHIEGIAYLNDWFISGYAVIPASGNEYFTFYVSLFNRSDSISDTFPETNSCAITIHTMGGEPEFFAVEVVHEIPIEAIDNPGHLRAKIRKVNDFYGINLHQYACRQISKKTNNRGIEVYGLYESTTFVGYTGINGFDVGCPMGCNAGGVSIYYQGNNLISIGKDGAPIAPCLSFGSNDFFTADIDLDQCFYYKANDGKWYSYVRTRNVELKNEILDNRYVIEWSYGVRGGRPSRVYDIETDTSELLGTDWIISRPPCFRDSYINSIIDTTGIVFAAGANAGYMISGSPFVGYLPNPFVCTNFPVLLGTLEPNIIQYYNVTQYYYTTGNTAQSALYKGIDPQYFGTVYPIDPNGNVVLPISQNAQLIKGYSNNDLVKEGNTVYPLMYYNNTQKTYTYMLLSGMENITNAFSLQGQQYTVDDENIYAVSFNTGVIQNATAVAYKKNLTFLGTLPTQAVFWSDFNKTFYAFTGDRILSRMFEASDINKIEYVGQNPATLSLWICTDDGIYVLSDKDMFKLDYNSKQVAFYSKNAFIVTEGATNNECHAISLYLNDNEQGEMIPVKLQTAYYGLGSEQKAVMDCWYLRLFDKDRTEGYVKVKVNTITDVTRHTEEKTFNISPSDYDDNNIFYLRYQPKYQECVAMQLELETNLGIYSMSLGVNTTDSTAQVSKFNF